MSFGAAVLTFREGLEGALIVAIMLGYLRKVGRPDVKWLVWAGALSAALFAVALTVSLQILGAQLEDPAAAIYEGFTALLAVAILTYMIFWMAKQSRYIKGSLEHSMKQTLVQGAGWSLFGLAFMTIAREGLETALFLSASAFASTGWATFVGGVVGVAVSMVLAWIVYAVGVRLQMRTFFRVTSFLLVIFAAALLRNGISEFEAIGWVPPLISPVWNTAAWLPADSGLGSVLQALTGYTSEPSLTQLIAYFGYLLVVGTLLLRPVKSQPVPATMPAPAQVVDSSVSSDSAEVRRDVTTPVG